LEYLTIDHRLLQFTVTRDGLELFGELATPELKPLQQALVQSYKGLESSMREIVSPQIILRVTESVKAENYNLRVVISLPIAG